MEWRKKHEGGKSVNARAHERREAEADDRRRQEAVCAKKKC